jgi:hypothetical protein
VTTLSGSPEIADKAIGELGQSGFLGRCQPGIQPLRLLAPHHGAERTSSIIRPSSDNAPLRASTDRCSIELIVSQSATSIHGARRFDGIFHTLSKGAVPDDDGSASRRRLTQRCPVRSCP